MSVTHQDPVERMFAATLTAGECFNDSQAPFSARWRVVTHRRPAMTFAEPTGNRLLMRGLIARHPEEPDVPKPIMRFVPVPRAEVSSQVVPKTPAAPEQVQHDTAPEILPTDDAATEQLPQRKAGRPAGCRNKGSDFGPWPHRSELIGLLDMIGLVLADTVGRHDSGIPAEMRAKLLMLAYQPTVRMLLRAKDGWPRAFARSPKAFAGSSKVVIGEPAVRPRQLSGAAEEVP